MRKVFGVFIAGMAVVSYTACKKDLTPVCDGSNPTYNGEIKAIIDNNCTGGLCHDNGSSKGDFTSYAGLLNVLENGKFKSEVLIDQSMPRNGSLNQQEIDAIQCWSENNYPEQ